jgi:rod shape-determining protein MreD
MKPPVWGTRRRNALARGLLAKSQSRGQRSGMASRIIGPWDWILAPALVSMGLTIVLATAFQPFGKYLPEPVAPLVLAFAWPIIRPSYIAPFVLAGLGLFLDFFWGAAIGFWTLNLMLVYGAMVLLRTYVIGQERMVLFGIYVAVELVFFAVGVILAAMDTGRMVRLVGVGEQILATTALFPAVLYLLEKYLHTDVRFS